MLSTVALFSSNSFLCGMFQEEELEAIKAIYDEDIEITNEIKLRKLIHVTIRSDENSYERLIIQAEVVIFKCSYIYIYCVSLYNVAVYFTRQLPQSITACISDKVCSPAPIIVFISVCGFITSYMIMVMCSSCQLSNQESHHISSNLDSMYRCCAIVNV